MGGDVGAFKTDRELFTFYITIILAVAGLVTNFENPNLCPW